MMWGYDPSGYGYGSMMGWGGFGLLFMIFWWAIIIAVAISLFRWFSHKCDGHDCEHSGRRIRHEYEKSALDLLKERYAKGEIDKDEFETKKKDLTEN